MANEEHLDVLRQGVAVWDTWKRELPDIAPDLGIEAPDWVVPMRMHLSETNPSETNFRGANLRGIDLCRRPRFCTAQ